MNKKALLKMNKFGKAGKVAMTAFMVITVIISVAMCVATVYVVALPKDAVTVNVTNQAEFKINNKNFSSVWEILGGNFAYSTDQDPEAILNNKNQTLLPPENQDLQTNIEFFNQNYSFARIHSENDLKILEAKSSPAVYHSDDLTAILIFLTLTVIAVSVTVWFIRRIFSVISVCESPFCEELVKKMKTFAFSLLPIILFASVSDTLSSNFLSAEKNTTLHIQWGVLIAFAVTMCLITVFKYGIQLQKESDETL